MTYQFLDFRIAKYDGVEIPAPALMLSFSNPIVGSAIWDAQVAKVENGRVQNWITGATGTGGLATPDIPIYFDIDFTTFLLRIMEYPAYPLPGPYLFGPYLVTLPKLGAYTWNSKEGKIDNIQAVNLPLSNNESDVIGTVGGWNWISEGKWGLSLILEESAPAFGKEDVASLYIGQPIYIEDASYPADSLGNPLIKAGERVTCRLKMVWAGYTYGWKAWDFHYPREYPDSAYIFTGSITIGGVVSREVYIEPLYPPAGTFWKDFREIHFSVAGNVPQFAASFILMFYYPSVTRVVGPCSKTLYVAEDDYQIGYFRGASIYAHPNPDAPPWTRETWDLNNWQLVS